jgi:hypothetical protein
MNIAQLIDIALASVDERQVEVMALEPAEVPARAVGSLVGLLSELTGVLLAAGTVERVRATGSWKVDSYGISISTPIGAFGDGVMAINRLLGEPVLAMGVASAARLAEGQGLTVRMAPDGAGAAFHVILPAHLVKKVAPPELPMMAEEPLAEFIPHEMERRVLVPVDSARDDTEAFLESVFGVLRDPWHEPDRPEPAVLQVREPGESFSMTEDDAPSISAAEAAVDIRSALSTFDRGRRAAEIAGEAVEATA